MPLGQANQEMLSSILLYAMDDGLVGSTDALLSGEENAVLGRASAQVRNGIG